ncbi:MAG TPA: GGDEF domain-containing protein, partial [Syntrophomonas sp.]|nr:GGDEF domain-containing protein [Syntrophomonas sp.]
QRIKNTLRIYDTVGRYGGEEFLLVLPGCSIDEARLIARRILNVVKNEPMLYHNNEISATISLGLAGNDSADHSDLKGIIQAADFAMRQAKEKGRNRYEVADD